MGPDGEYQYGTDEDEEQGPCEKMGSGLALMCIGVILFPLSLVLLGYNEKNYVCEHNNILYAEKNAAVLQCSSGSDYAPNTPVFFACSIDQSSMPTWTPTSFGSSGLGQQLSFASVAGAQTAEMLQCVEKYEGETKDPNGNKIKTYSYSQQWQDHVVDSSQFSQSQSSSSARARGCPGFNGNPAWPSGISQSTETEMAQSIRAGAFTVGHSLLEKGISVDMTRPLPVQSFANAFQSLNALPQMPPVGGYTSLTTQNVAVGGSGQELVTCSGQSYLGCMKITYYKNWDTSVSAITALQSGGYTIPIDAPGGWGCSGGEWESLKGGELSFASYIDALKSANQTITWIMRFCGLCAAWAAIFCCLQPISAAVDVFGDYLRCIPCCGEWLEDVLEGMVTFLLCGISCAAGCSCGLVVIALAWLYMRPLVSGGILLGAAVLLCCAAVISHQNKKEKFDKDSDEYDMEMPAMGGYGGYS